MILFILVAAAIFFGASNASKELVKERAIFRRERLVNLGLVPYVLSKVCVLGVIGIVQSALLVGLCALGGLLPPTLAPAMVAALVGILSLTFLAGASLGLVLSALAPNPDFATSMVPLILLPQLMFSGVLTPPPSHTVAMSFQLSDWLAQATIAKWALELLGHATGLIDVLGAQNSGVLLEYKDAFAGAGWWPHVTVLTGLVVLFLGGTLIALESKAQLP